MHIIAIGVCCFTILSSNVRALKEYQLYVFRLHLLNFVENSFLFQSSGYSSIDQEEALAKEYLSTYNVKASDVCYRSKMARWKFDTDITDENERIKVFYFISILQVLIT